MPPTAPLSGYTSGDASLKTGSERVATLTLSVTTRTPAKIDSIGKRSLQQNFLRFSSAEDLPLGFYGATYRIAPGGERGGSLWSQTPLRLNDDTP